MFRLIIFGVILCLFTSCKEEKSDAVLNEDMGNGISVDDWPAKSSVEPKARVVLNDWPEYQTMEQSFDALFTVSNREDLSLVIDNMIEAQKNLSKSKYPEPFDSPRVKSRQKVFTTYMLKVKGDIYYRVDPKASILQMIEAYNVFRDQFNTIVNNTLDTRLILEE